MICPECRKDTLKTYKCIRKSTKNFRYLECTKCKKNFKSVEYIPSNWDYERLYKNLKKDLISLVSKYRNDYDKSGEW